MRNRLSGSHIRTFLIVTCFYLIGCSNSDEASLSITESVRAPAVLLSELNEVNTRTSVVNCPIEITNDSNSSETVTVLGTGCACYGLVHDGKSIGKGENLVIPAKSAISLKIDAQVPTSESSEDYRITFEVPSGSSTAQKEVHCQLQVYRDIRLFPNALICDTAPGETITVQKDLTVERIFRSETGESPEPTVENLPEGILLKDVITVGEPIELEPDLWKSAWNLSFQCEVSGSLTASGVTDTYAVSFPVEPDTIGEKKGIPSLSSTAKVIRRVRVPIQFPERVHFGKIPCGQLRQRVIFLSSIDRDPFELTLHPEQLPAGLQVVLDQERSHQQRVKVSLESSNPGNWSGVLQLRTNRPDQPLIEIELSANFFEAKTN